MTMGIGYQEERDRRMSEGIRSSSIEDSGNEKYIVYFGRAHVIDHQSKIEARGPLKIGRAKFASALMRGRNQPGVDFRIYAEIVFHSNRATEIAEKFIARKLEHKNIRYSQGQQELYNILDSELPQIFNDIVQDLKHDPKLKVKQAVLFNLDNAGLAIETVIVDNKYEKVENLFNIFFGND